ncbi:vault poly [Fusarium longipes]|uniref:Vault poly n=1 Tax=Fusarium longipes TaxID=694270 RepID=A0A395SWT4_9HYPO|nr:vault poly [Fusarium longipes]
MFGPRRPPNCGCYIYVDQNVKYLPQVQAKAHTAILATTSRTNLSQTFVNPTADTIQELRYVFPLYDGVSVVAFTCTVGSKTIKGVVKERQKAQQDYDKAKSKGQVAGLFKQSLEAADTFTTAIGNVPANEKVHVDITYLGELKHDAQVDGVRFTIPTQIVPRYGTTESLAESNVHQQGFSFTIDAEMPNGSSIKSIQSPSHPLSVEIGTTSTTKLQEPSLRRASATLQQGTTHLEQDFVVQVVATNLGEPSAVLEIHPDMPNQRAIMTTLVPKFKLPAEKPEIVFICDRSGSMGDQIPNLITALEVFLKSLPVGIKFNICSFGSNHTFLWERSQTYSQETLNIAVQHVHGFSANYGGTEMYGPFEATFKKRYKDMNLEVFLLTDGEIWDQDRLFNLINNEISESKGTARVFSLGIGSGASTSLIEGIARAGNGFAQTVADDEKMDRKVVRMLRGALFPHITDYSLEIKYEKVESSADDDFELVEKVMDDLQIGTAGDVDNRAGESQVSKKPVSLFDSSIDNDEDNVMSNASAVDDKFDHLPTVSVPRYLQTPSQIPPLFPFNRTTVYVLLSDATPNQRPKSVVLRGTSCHGPLELEIPVTEFAEKDSTIHRLAARKEIKELEEGRGWLTHAKDSDGELFKQKYDGRFADMVEREAVRLGVKFQVGSKWCSFVAIQDDGEDEEELQLREDNSGEGDDSIVSPRRGARMRSMHTGYPPSRFSMATRARVGAPFSSVLVGSSNSAGGLFGSASGGSSNSPGGLFGSAPGGPLRLVAPQEAAVAYQSSCGPINPFAAATSLFGATPINNNQQPQLQQAAAFSPSVPFASMRKAQQFHLDAMPTEEEAEDSDEDMGYGLFDGDPVAPPAPPAPEPINARDPLKALTSLQNFSGSWAWSPDLERTLGVSLDEVTRLDLPSVVLGHTGKNDILATACAVLFFKRKLNDEEDIWEMLVEKAEAWLESNIREDGVNELKSVLEKLF